ncbi:MAG: hypothetical protein AAB697_02840 [Patescibacteria group bacterium]
MRKIGIILLVLGIIFTGVVTYLKLTKKAPTTVIPRPPTVTTETFAGAPNYRVYGYVTEWFPSSDTLEVNLYLGKTVNLKVGDVSKSYVLAPSPKDRTQITVIYKDTYTFQEWQGAFCKGDILLIGTKDNIWTTIQNNQQIEPNFVNVEDRTCYDLPAK